MKELLKTYFGYDRFRSFQEEIIEHVLQGKDALVLMPTGGGKSLCYQLPALKLEGVTLVISPLISLMKDQVDALKANGIPAEFINSSLSFQEISHIRKKLLEGEISILYLAPERLALDSFQRFLQELSVSLIAVDEAHCVSEWGHEFRPDYRNLSQFKEQFPQVPVIALTATATPRVQADIIDQLSLDNPRTFISSFDRKNLRLIVRRKKNAFPKLLQLLEKYKNESAIIYCFSRKETENLAENLHLNGFKALPYHAGLDKETRMRNQELFIKDEIQVMAATIAFGMGIDKPDVRLVVHYSFPKTLEGYYQEVGRAGRDGLPSDCVLFYSYGDKRKHDYFINEMENPEEQENIRKKLHQVIEYCDLNSCRRKYLLRYFGEELAEENCGGCDFCLSPQTTFDATIITQKIMSCILRTDSRFGKKYITDILKGRKIQKIISNNHDQLSVFGIVPDFSEEEIKHIMKLLLTKGLLETSAGEYPTLCLTAEGHRWLKQREQLELIAPPKDLTDQKRERQEPEYTAEYDVELFEKLRALRKQIAESKEVPPFVIFGDVSLREMAYYLPPDPDNFLGIKGVGNQKSADYGERFLAVINEHVKENQLISIEIPSQRKNVSRPVPGCHNSVPGSHNTVKPIGSNHLKTREMIKRKFSLHEIAGAQGFKQRTIAQHIEKLVEHEELDIAYLMPPEEETEEILAALRHCGTERLKPIHEFLEGKYSYDNISLVRSLYKLKHREKS